MTKYLACCYQWVSTEGDYGALAEVCTLLSAFLVYFVGLVNNMTKKSESCYIFPKSKVTFCNDLMETQFKWDMSDLKSNRKQIAVFEL